MNVGHEVSSGLYYERLEPAGTQERAPILMIHGGGATGACFRTNLAGGPGWADQLAALGHEVWVTDWPGCGRSGGRQLVDIAYEDVVAGYRRLLRDAIGKPVVVMPHSMGGATAWQLVEHDRDLVLGVVALAASYPGNVPPRSTVLSDDGRTLVARFDETGVEFIVDRERGYIYEDGYVYNQGIATSTRFPMDKVAELRSGFVGLSPTMLQQRIGVVPGLPSVASTESFQGVPIRLVSGTEDPAHTYETEKATAEQFRGWGADVELAALKDRDIVGNGHFLFFEDNEREVLEIVASQVEEVHRLGLRALGQDVD